MVVICLVTITAIAVTNQAKTMSGMQHVETSGEYIPKIHTKHNSWVVQKFPCNHLLPMLDGLG